MDTKGPVYVALCVVASSCTVAYTRKTIAVGDIPLSLDTDYGKSIAPKYVPMLCSYRNFYANSVKIS